MSSVPEMPSREYFEDEAKLKGFLANQLKRGRLALLLGAGISNSFGLPNWKQLIGRMYDKEKAPIPPDVDEPEAAEYFRVHYCDTYTTYLRKVHDALYDGADLGLASIRKFGTLTAVGALVMASRRGSACVATFNFDSVLELYLRYHGFDVEPIIEPSAWASSADVGVLHPHGFLSHEGGSFSKKILFAQDEYDEAVGRPEWPWRIPLEAMMRTHTCLFLGLSGKDQNLRSIMKTMQTANAGICEGNCFWGVSFRDGADDGRDDFWEHRLVYRQVVFDFKEGLAEFLFGICQQAARCL